MAWDKRMIFSLSDEDYGNLDGLSKHYDITMSGILRIGLLSLVRHHNKHHRLPNHDGVKLRERKSS